jgi:hypothetical protein
MIMKVPSLKVAFPVAIFLYMLCFAIFLTGIHHVPQWQNIVLEGIGAMDLEKTVTSRSISNLKSVSWHELSYVHERSNLDAPSVFLAIPSIPRVGDQNYLLLVLQSLENSHFPLPRTYVFYNGNPDQRTHLRWQQSETLFSSKGVHFLWNDAPVPEPHPAAYDMAQPLPREVNGTDEKIQEALHDTVSRKDWRRKECHDFRIISKHMLHLVYDGVNLNDPVDVSRRDNSWIIFNQDDAQWNIEFLFVWEKLNSALSNVTRWDISRQGLVSAAFRADFLLSILEKSKLWCDFLPVDWMVWSFEDEHHSTAGAPEGENWIKHIGKVSTKDGVVNDRPPPPPQSNQPITHIVKARIKRGK